MCSCVPLLRYIFPHFTPSNGVFGEEHVPLRHAAPDCQRNARFPINGLSLSTVYIPASRLFHAPVLYLCFSFFTATLRTAWQLKLVGGP